jgi:ribosome-binding protein aMBF1 (putative translation factor)
MGDPQMTFNNEIKSDALRYLYDRYIKDDPEAIAAVEAEMLNAEVAQKVYDLRTAAGLSPVELAEQVGVDPLVIEDLEDCDYKGNSIQMLARIAASFGKMVTLKWTETESQAGSCDKPDHRYELGLS